jgi:hypothetical protein
MVPAARTAMMRRLHPVSSTARLEFSDRLRAARIASARDAAISQLADPDASAVLRYVDVLGRARDDGSDGSTDRGPSSLADGYDALVDEALLLAIDAGPFDKK